MKLLALDTSSDACSVAIMAGSDLVESHVVEAREHTRILVPTIRDLLADSGMALADLDAIVLGNGPGSFIGMRIGASVAQGLAFGAGLRVVPVSSLAAVAAEVFSTSDDDRVVVAQDARMHQVYAGTFARGKRDLPASVGEEQIVAVDCDFGAAAPFAAGGKGWSRYPELTERNKVYISADRGVDVPRARYLLALGAESWRRGQAVDPADIAPAYLRSKVADAPASG